MRKIKLLLAGLLLSVSTAFCADTSLFNEKEASVSLSTGYVFNHNADSVGDAFSEEYDFNLNAGVQYFFNKYLGVEANLPFYQTKGVSVNEVGGGLLLRVPLSDNKLVLKNIAPYIGLGGIYNWRGGEETLTYLAKAGLEARINPKWGVFAEAQFRDQDFDFSNGATSLVGGVKLVF